MSNWGPVTFTVGSSSVGSFPMAQFKSVSTASRFRGFSIADINELGKQPYDNQMDRVTLSDRYFLCRLPRTHELICTQGHEPCASALVRRLQEVDPR